MKKDIQEQLIEPEANAPEEAKKDNHAVGVFWFIVAGFCFALNFIFGKLLYESQPDLMPL